MNRAFFSFASALALSFLIGMFGCSSNKVLRIEGQSAELKTFETTFSLTPYSNDEFRIAVPHGLELKKQQFHYVGGHPAGSGVGALYLIAPYPYRNIGLKAAAFLAEQKITSEPSYAVTHRESRPVTLANGDKGYLHIVYFENTDRHENHMIYVLTCDHPVKKDSIWNVRIECWADKNEGDFNAAQARRMLSPDSDLSKKLQASILTFFPHH